MALGSQQVLIIAEKVIFLESKGASREGEVGAFDSCSNRAGRDVGGYLIPPIYLSYDTSSEK